MPPTVVVEDGTVVPGANSFVAVADVDQYALDRGRGDWSGSADDKATATIRAADYLRNEARFIYRGTKATSAQRMPWPRTGASEYRGGTIAVNEIPWRLKDAQCELAIRAVIEGVDLQPDLDRGGAVRSSTVGPISTSWFDGAPAETTIQVVMGILNPILRLRVTDIPPVLIQAVPDPEFTSGAFDNASELPGTDGTS